MEVQVEKIHTVKMWSLSFIFVTLSNAFLFMVFEMLLPTLPYVLLQGFWLNDLTKNIYLYLELLLVPAQPVHITWRQM